MSVPRVLILYPALFGCFPKFQRKVEKILQRMDAFEIVYLDDPCGFIKKLFSTNNKCLSLSRREGFRGVSHAIVFDDGEEFPSQVNALGEMQIKLRFVRIQITRVINIKRESGYRKGENSASFEYIGRGSRWGNPHSMYDGSADEGPESRDEVIRKFAYDFERGHLPFDKDAVRALAGKRLGCFCKPEACHGDVLASYLNSFDDGK